MGVCWKDVVGCCGMGAVSVLGIVCVRVVKRDEGEAAGIASLAQLVGGNFGCTWFA